MKRIEKISVVLAVVIVSGLLIFATTYASKDKLDKEKEYTSSYFPAAANFAGEATPLRIIDVKERLDR